MNKIIPLSNETLNDAILLIENIFLYKPDQSLARWSFRESLSKPDSYINYWVAVNEGGTILGITGLYIDKYDKTVIWLGWFGVHPRYRRQGVGSKLLEFAIDEAKRRGFSILKLYTSSDQNERAAHQLYKKYGFIQFAINEEADKIYFAKNLTEETMGQYTIKIEWEGPFGLNEVIEKMNDAGEKPTWAGNDYGLYQIYGWHILCGKNTLLYIGQTTQRTFSGRFSEHRCWLDKDQDKKDINIYLGRIYNPDIHSEKDKWKSWKKDIEIAEKILIYRYSPNYNSKAQAEAPNLHPHKNVRLIHSGKRHKLKDKDIAPRDF